MSMENIKDVLGVPRKETDLGNLTAQQIIDKIQSFYVRYGKEDGHGSDFSESDFLILLVSYPVSMCSYSMTETLKLLIALIYFSQLPSEAAIEEAKAYAKANKCKMSSLGVSFDELALVFDRSKATIHEAIKKKETEAKAILQEEKLRQRFIEEKRVKLLKGSEVNP